VILISSPGGWAEKGHEHPLPLYARVVLDAHRKLQAELIQHVIVIEQRDLVRGEPQFSSVRTVEPVLRLRK